MNERKWETFSSIIVGSIGGVGLSIAADRVLGSDIPTVLFVVLGLLTVASIIVAAIAALLEIQPVHWLAAILLGAVSFWLLFIFGLSFVSETRTGPADPLALATPIMVPQTVIVVVTPVVVTATPTEGVEPQPAATSAAPPPPPPATPTPAPREVELTTLAQVRASGHSVASNDTCDPPHTTTYLASNLVDGQANTAWRVDGDGAGESFTADFPRTVRLTRMQIMPGYAKTDPCDSSLNWCLRNRIPKDVVLEFTSGERISFELEDACRWQELLLPNVETQSVRLIVIDSHPWKVEHHTPYTSISEVRFFGIAP
jgi:hypothetical protein